MPKGIVTLRSMTGFGSSSFTTGFGRFDIEMQSLNRRHLEINLMLPKQFGNLESELRAWLSSKVGRGQVSLSLYWKKMGVEGCLITPNIAFAHALKEALEKLAMALNIEPKVTLEMLVAEKEVMIVEELGLDEKQFRSEFYHSLEMAFEQFESVKNEEGFSLAKDFKRRLEQLYVWILNIEKHAKDAVHLYRQKLLDRLKEVFKQDLDEDVRVLKEIALFAEKADIDEEIVRFKSHLNQMQAMIGTPLKSPTDTKGKRLEFLLQELLRECNTIGSKSGSLQVATTVIDIKCELERLREQVQNVE